MDREVKGLGHNYSFSSCIDAAVKNPIALEVKEVDVRNSTRVSTKVSEVGSFNFSEIENSLNEAIEDRKREVEILRNGLGYAVCCNTSHKTTGVALIVLGGILGLSSVALMDYLGDKFSWRDEKVLLSIFGALFSLALLKWGVKKNKYRE